jgi:PAS domain S-box-containing protein
MADPDKRTYADRFDQTNGLINDLARRASGLTGDDRQLFLDALEEIQITLEELEAMGEEFTQQAEELAAAREAADEERRRYAGLFAFAPDAYLVTDPSGVVIEANERAGLLFGLKPSLFVKKPLVALVDPKDRKAYFAQLGRLAQEERLENWEVYFRSRTRRVFPGLVDITTVRSPKGEMTGYRWVIRDATEAKRREEQARLATFPELNPEPVIEVDTAGHIYYINRAAKRLLRELPEKGLDHPWLAGLPDAAERLWRSRKQSLSREIEIDGRSFLQMIWSPGRGERLRIYGRDITERKAAEKKLRKSERDYRDLVDNANSIIVRWKPDGEITYFNRFAQTFFGYSANEILGRSARILLPEKDSEGLDMSRLVDEIVAMPDFFARHENENVLRDGRRVWVQWANKAVLDDRGNVREILAIGNDMTARKTAEDALRVQQTLLEDQVAERTADLLRSSELLERVFASVDLAIAFLDTDFNFLRVNPAFAHSFGGSPESYEGRSLFALYPDAEKRAIFDRVVETGVAHVEFESPFLLEPERLKGSFWDWSLQRVAAGEAVQGVVLSMVDVTSRVRAQEEERRLSTAVEQSAEAVVITDLADRILYANRTFLALHGFARSDVLGLKYGEVLKLDLEDETFRERLRLALDAGEIWKGRLTRTLDGQPDRKLDVTISPVRDPSGTIVNYAVLEHDATREHRLEASVRNLQKLDALGALAGGIAHDFNNILVPIFLNAELAAFEADKDGPASRYAKLILEAANRGRELVRQIIAFSRPTEQKRDVIDAEAVIKEAVQFLRASIPRSITIVERYDAASARVRADPTQIHQILMNLGTNAAFAMREKGGRLTIGLAGAVVTPEQAALNLELAPGPFVRLMVEDEGCGMTPDILERIFDPFFTTKRRGEGTGMGLPVVRGIVKSHGGAIVVSTVPGEGTAFEVYLPSAKGRARPAPSASETVLSGKGRVLFVDDEDMLVRSVRSMLDRLGYSVTATTDPLEALRLFTDHPRDFDLVLTDETMPGLTGAKLAEKMLSIRPDLPIILTTGFSDLVHEEEALAAGIRGFIMKPFSTSEIAEKIRQAMMNA